jgi:hydroxymethylpyrimidine pyrophosphatase-like HAD family hydrolase
MRYTALATDYDGTIATHGTVDEPTHAALRRGRAAGLRIMLVTGREIPSLHKLCPAVDELFDRVVAENGAVLYTPATGSDRLLCDAPPGPLLEALERRGVPLWVGRSVVATHEPHGASVRDALAETGVDWRITMNKESIMVLPPGVTKASGVGVALADLGLPAERCVGVGDAENDLDLLRACGLGVAVANAIPSLKAVAGWVTAYDRGAGVAELIDRMLADDL